jgi:hypothetical protein
MNVVENEEKEYFLDQEEKDEKLKGKRYWVSSLLLINYKLNKYQSN